MSDKPKAIWKPKPAQIKKTHLSLWLKELRLKNYDALFQWALKNPSAFWDRAIHAVGIQFQKPYSDVLDLSQGAKNPKWCKGAELNIAESCFQAKSKRIAIVYQAEGDKIKKITYGELQKLSNQVAFSLKKLGYKKNDAIAVDLPMTVESIAIYLGIVKLGASVVGIADSFAAQEIATRLRISNAKLIFTQDHILREGKKLPLYAKVIEATDIPAIVLPALKKIDTSLRSQDLDWKSFLVKNSKFEVTSCKPEDTMNILFSSGTTGDPKAIPWTHLTPIKCATDAYFYHDLHEGDVMAWPTSLGWMMGPWLIYAALINKATIGLYYGLPHSRGFGQFIQKAKVKILGVVPSLVKHWKNSGALKGLNWKCLRAFSSTGECSNPIDMSWLMKFAGGKPVIEYCGGTEIGGAYITSTLLKPNVPAAFNTPTLGLDVRLLDESGQPTQNGELYIIPPSIGLSQRLLNKNHDEVYYDDTPVHSGGVLLRRHGDQMEDLGHGYFRAHGRVDDTMNLGGIKVSSAEIESVLNKTKDVIEPAAIAVPPPGGGPSLLVVYAVTRGPIGTEELFIQLQNAIKSELNPLFKISELKIVNTLPRTASNKVMRRVLRTEYLKQ